MRSIIFLFCIALSSCTFQKENTNTAYELTKDSAAVATKELPKKEVKKKTTKVKKKLVAKTPPKDGQGMSIQLEPQNRSRTRRATRKDYSALHEEAKEFCKKNRLNKDYYFLLDFSIPSGKNRFFIYNFELDSIVQKKLVTHGACDVFNDNWDPWDSASFSDQPNSHCSSKGKYKIGKRAFSNWGINVKYWIKGMEDSNKSAEKRIVVLHSWGLVSDEEVYPEHCPLSWGCPAVSNNFMLELDERLKKSRRPVLLWIVE